MFIKIGELKPSDYKGIKVMAAYGLHSDVFELMRPFLSKGMRVLDFGCGQGAFSQRMVDAGLIVDGCDINTSQIVAEVNRKIMVDLNSDISLEDFPDKYDILIAMEILEHLKNPWKYIADCKSLIKEDGIIVLSTPNISNFISRMRFMMKGTLLAFEKQDFAHGHVTPLSFVQLENMFESSGLQILKKGHAGTIPVFHFSGISLFSFFRNTILPLLFPFMSGPKRGRALVYIMKKKKI